MTDDGYCSRCGSGLASGARFCGACGAAVEPTFAGEGTEEPLPLDPVPPASPGLAPDGKSRRPSRRGVGVAAIALCCFLAAGAAGVAVYLLASGAEEAEAVVLEPVDYTRPDDFARNLDADVEAARRAARALARSGSQPPGEPSGAALVADGSAPALYGGSQNERVCDVGALIAFLEDPANAAKARAFASVLGIPRGRIAAYVRALTAVRLAHDTRITNHGFEAGQATPSQSLLQAGTGVLVDDRGLPRVKCNCGNPLAPPASAAVDLSAAANPEAAWRGLDPARAVAIEPAPEALEAIELADLDDPIERIERPVGSDGEEGDRVDNGPVPNQLAASGTHVCAIHDDGFIECWGDMSAEHFLPPEGEFVALTGGGEHFCALREDGTAACWGDDNHGQAAAPGGSFSQLAAGGYHTCGLRDDGSVECWGEELPPASNPAPGAADPPPAGFTELVAGSVHTCGLRFGGEVECWGANELDQLKVPQATFTRLAAGDYHTCAINERGRVKCWGFIDADRLSAPGGQFVEIAAGLAHACGLTENRHAECWGSDEEGQASPPGSQFTDLVAGGDTSCGVREDGDAECWGRHETMPSLLPLRAGGTANRTDCGGWFEPQTDNGYSEVVAEGLGCGEARRIVREYVLDQYVPRSGPAGWTCRDAGDDGDYYVHRCRRHGQRLVLKAPCFGDCLARSPTRRLPMDGARWIGVTPDEI